MTSETEVKLIAAVERIETTCEDMRGNIRTLFHAIEGNGQPGLKQRLTVMETNCKAIQQAKSDQAEEQKERRGLHWGAWLAIGTMAAPAAIDMVMRLSGK